MKKNFVEPEIEVIRVNAEFVTATSCIMNICTDDVCFTDGMCSKQGDEIFGD